MIADVRSNFNILILEDTEIQRNLYRHVLEWEGYKTIGAENAEEAFNLLLQGIQVDLMVVDQMLPEINGDQFLEKIHTDSTFSRFRNTPFIFLTAYPDDKGILAMGAKYLHMRVMRKPMNDYHDLIVVADGTLGLQN